MIVLLTLQGLPLAGAATPLPGLEGIAGAALMPNLGRSVPGILGVESVAEFAARLFAPEPVRAMTSHPAVLAVAESPADAPEAPSSSEPPVTIVRPPESKGKPDPIPKGSGSGQPPTSGTASGSAASGSATSESGASGTSGVADGARETSSSGTSGGGSQTGGAGDAPPMMNYVVRRGDDLQALAARFGTTAAFIAQVSGIPVNQILYPGMVLRVPVPEPAMAEPPLKAVAIPWSEVDRIWAVGTVAQVTDVWTGRIFYVIRQGGWAHADSEPLSWNDTKTMLANYGGAWSWSRRPIVVVVNGYRIAASQNGMPHGGSTIDNGFPGHFCIHFLGSTTHGSSYTVNGVPTLDPAHQWCVQQAVGH